MKTIEQIKQRVKFIENLLNYGDEFLDISLTVAKRRKYYIELRILKWVLEEELK